MNEDRLKQANDLRELVKRLEHASREVDETRKDYARSIYQAFTVTELTPEARHQVLRIAQEDFDSQLRCAKEAFEAL